MQRAEEGERRRSRARAGGRGRRGAGWLDTRPEAEEAGEGWWWGVELVLVLVSESCMGITPDVNTKSIPSSPSSSSPSLPLCTAFRAISMRTSVMRGRVSLTNTLVPGAAFLIEEEVLVCA